MEWKDDKRNAPRRGGKGNIWYLAGPILIKWAIAAGVSTIGMFVFYLLYVSEHYEEAASYMMDVQKMNLFANGLLKEFVKYTTLLEGIAALITIPIMLLFMRQDRKKEQEQGIRRMGKGSGGVCCLGILMALAASIALNGLILIGNLSQYSESYKTTMKAMYASPFVIQILSLGILIPICEELVFRGLLYKRLRGQYGFLYAAGLSAAVFGVMHINLVQMLYGFCLGGLLAYLYEKQGSVLAPVLAHSVMNLFSVIGTRYNWFEFLLRDHRYIGGVTVGCAAVAATLFVLLQRVENDG